VTMPDSPLVLAEQRETVLVLTLNRPERMNAWTDALEDQYFERLAAAEANPAVRAIVVTGAGRGFCAGADLDDLAAVGATREVARRAVTDRPPRSFPFTIRKPLIAAMNGAAAGLGLVEALYCDVRFATPTAKLTTAFARRGLIAEYGISWLLPRLVGVSRALDLLISGRVVLGDEAERMGLVDHVVPAERLVDEAVAYALDLGRNCSPTSMAVIKGQVRRHLAATFAEAVADSDQLMLDSFGWPDLAEGLRSYGERRAPAFSPLASHMLPTFSSFASGAS
jgi:enoyl-CoA hydratase/carnithine racemase